MPHSPATVQKMLVNIPETLSNGQGFHTHTPRSGAGISFTLKVLITTASFASKGPIHGHAADP